MQGKYSEFDWLLKVWTIVKEGSILVSLCIPGSLRLLYKETQDSMLFRAHSPQNVKTWKNVKNCTGDYGMGGRDWGGGSEGVGGWWSERGKG